MKKETKFFIALIAIAVLTCIIVLIAGRANDKAGEPMIAKIRYFDGSLDTLEITEYRLDNGSIAFKSIDGVTTVTGANNVIIIRGDRPE